MSFHKVYIHFVWSTKCRYPFLDSKALRIKVWRHIKENAKEKGIFIDFVNGFEDHCHCLVSLRYDQSMQFVMQMIKGESAFWINKEGLCKEKFKWQREYYAISVSGYETSVERVRNYIRNQEEHHRKKSSQEEFDELILKYGFEKFED